MPTPTILIILLKISGVVITANIRKLSFETLQNLLFQRFINGKKSSELMDAKNMKTSQKPNGRLTAVRTSQRTYYCTETHQPYGNVSKENAMMEKKRYGH